MIQPIYVKADNSQLYKQLDAAIEKRAHYVEVKENQHGSFDIKGTYTVKDSQYGSKDAYIMNYVQSNTSIILM